MPSGEPEVGTTSYSKKGDKEAEKEAEWRPQPSKHVEWRPQWNTKVQWHIKYSSGAAWCSHDARRVMSMMRLWTITVSTLGQGNRWMFPGNSGRELGELGCQFITSAYTHTNTTHSHLAAHSHLGNQPKCIFFGQLEVTGRIPSDRKLRVEPGTLGCYKTNSLYTLKLNIYF